MSSTSRRLLTVGLCGTLLATSEGCSTATAAGCGTGVAAAVLLGAVSAAAANSGNAEGEQVDLDPGKVVLGSAVFGVVVGCTAAAVADGIAGRRHASSEPVRYDDDYEPARRPTPSAAVPRPEGLTSARASLDGLVLQWLAQPRTEPRMVKLRLQPPARHPAKCTELTVLIDDEEHTVPLTEALPQAISAAQPAVEAELDLELVTRMHTTRPAELRLCGLSRRVTLPALEAGQHFLERFRALAEPEPTPQQVPMPEPNANATPAPEVHAPGPSVEVPQGADGSSPSTVQ